MIRILLVEDHILVRKGIFSLLDAEEDIEIVGEASNGNEALSGAEQLHPDLIIMDISLPELNGIEATRLIKKQFPEIKILVLTMHQNEEYVLQLLQAGASGYVIKQSIPSELLTAIRAVHQGDAYLSPSVSRSLIDEYLRFAPNADQPLDMYAQLTDREREVLQLLAEGFAPREIAEKLVISVKTVSVHRTNLMEKLNLSSMPDLVKFALRRGIITLD